jgi:hypothetical protein
MEGPHRRSGNIFGHRENSPSTTLRDKFEAARSFNAKKQRILA